MADSKIKVHVMHTGEVCVSPKIPFGGERTSMVVAAGLTTKWKDRIWCPVSSYLIETPKGKVLFDTGWDRSMSPKGEYNLLAQLKSLGSPQLVICDQGKLAKGAAVDEQLNAMGIEIKDLDYVIISHLDCDHVNGLRQVKDAKNILVSKDEYKFAKKQGRPRFQKKWWRHVKLKTFDWNDTEGPVGRSYDLFGDGTIQLINVPGHTDGLVCMKITGEDGRYVLLTSDNGYASKSWEDFIIPGIGSDRDLQKKSLLWGRDAAHDPKCIEAIANHDNDVAPHIIEL